MVSVPLSMFRVCSALIASLERPVYKEKLRVRSYGIPGESSSVFVELKKKYDGIVYKRRVTMALTEVEPFLCGLLPPAQFGQIGREINWPRRCRLQRRGRRTVC